MIMTAFASPISPPIFANTPWPSRWRDWSSGTIAPGSRPSPYHSGPDDDSETRTRIKGAFERFIDVDPQGDFDTAKLLRTLEVDIAVDLMGFTQDCRPGVLAPHPASLQVGFLGYPGTTGTDFIDYIIADRIVVPQEERVFYSEKVVHLPDCCQPSDRRKVAAPHATAKRARANRPCFR
jgi:predicted O-linked N-acetylglucosamine transferase (SPINDLY family)